MQIVHILGLLAISASVKANVLNSRVLSSCGYISNKIYCYGGDISNVVNVFRPESRLYVLDIGQMYGQQSSTFNNKWNEVIASNNFDVEVRRAPEYVFFPEQNQIVIVGGFSSNTVFTNQTIAYDTVSNTWKSLPAYSEPNRPRRQIYFATSINLISATNDTVAFYGGYESLPSTTVPMISSTGQNITNINNGTSIRGFDSLTVFNITSQTWSYFSPQQAFPDPDFYPNSQSATFNPRTGRIYYFGGSYYTHTNYGPIRFPFSKTYIFNTIQGTWSLQPLAATIGSSVPSDRIYHTTTLLPNSDHILLYGGTNDGRIGLTDFCYTLDLTTYEWTNQVNVTVPTSVSASGVRYGHSAVLVNTTLFILFGSDINGNGSPNLLTFDISNVSNIQYTPTYPLLPATVSNPSNPSNNNNNTAIPQPASADLSSGAKAGIAIGCILGVAAIAGIIFFFVRRKRESKGGEEVMQVDWDKIENQYREVQAPPIYTTHAPSTNEVVRQTPDVFLSEPTKGISPSAH
ncbi:hypothetical protein RMATCC62417_12144 [Rhizopus microsporus]|nr:hypothetical protein RMATCC62417_12144 [Rhizopus microsporus]